MTNTRKLDSIFAQIGYEIINYRSGVYHLQQRSADGALEFDGVALLYVRHPLAEHRTVEFFALDGRHPVTKAAAPADQIERMLDGWTVADARRLGESGLYSVVLDLDVCQAIKVGDDGLCMPRHADPDRLRYYVTLNTGDIACYN